MTESLDLDALEAVARASVAACEDDWYEVGSYTLSAPTISPVDREFIAAFSPAVAADLIGRVREAEEDLKLARNLSDGSRQFYDWGSKQRDRAEKAEAVIERIREARANHPVCDVHPDGDAVTCGWKATVIDIDRALGR